MKNKKKNYCSDCEQEITGNHKHFYNVRDWNFKEGWKEWKELICCFCANCQS